MTGYDHHQQAHSGEDYYWGKQPNGFARKALKFSCLDHKVSKLRAIDLGAGEGHDAIFFAQNGFDTLAVDVAPNGLKKAVRLAEESGVEVRVQQGDIDTFELVGGWDLIYSIGTIQYIEPQNRRSRLDHFQQHHTSPGGINALFAFTDHPEVSPAPDWGDDEHLCAPSELSKYYEEWHCLYSKSFIFEDDSDGTPHQHAAEEHIFQKSIFSDMTQ